jgi:Na+-translocating ferredoxin:NAD+ oxidoreductase RnfG subunit
MKSLLILIIILIISIVGCSLDKEIDKEIKEEALEIKEDSISDDKQIIENSEEIHEENQQIPEEEEPLPELSAKEPLYDEESENDMTSAPADEPLAELEQTVPTEEPLIEPEQTVPFEEAEEIISQPEEYIGEDRGIGGPIKVLVKMKDDKITDIEVVYHNETKGVGTNAIDTIISSIIENQTTDVDTVSGATVTSKALLNAVKNAIDKKE